jgi:hypothetical protein
MIDTNTTINTVINNDHHYCNNIQPQYLQITSSILLVSFVFFIFYSRKNIPEITLAILVLIAFIFSQLFWNNPIQYSYIHKIDAFIAKIAILLFICYTLFYKRLGNILLYTYLCFIAFMIYFFYLSDYFSKNEWCCSSHLFYHGLSHLCCGVASLYAFI